MAALEEDISILDKIISHTETYRSTGLAIAISNNK
jgi:hypothetical protein